jgi:predicted nucleic acid-binding protein
MAADPVFFDTNVLVYVSRPNAPEHAVARMVHGRIETDGCPLWTSQQVLREYLAVVTRPQKTSPPLPVARAIADVLRFQASFEMADGRPTVLERLLALLPAV